MQDQGGSRATLTHTGAERLFLTRKCGERVQAEQTAEASPVNELSVGPVPDVDTVAVPARVHEAVLVPVEVLHDHHLLVVRLQLHRPVQNRPLTRRFHCSAENTGSVVLRLCSEAAGRELVIQRLRTLRQTGSAVQWA